MLASMFNDLREMKIKYLVVCLFCVIGVSISACQPIHTVKTKPSNFDPNYRLVIPSSSAALTAIDGRDDDPIWNDSFHLGFIDGTDVDIASMKGVADNDNVYLYFMIEEADYSFDDTLAIVVSPDPSNPDDNRLLLIHPCPTAAAVTICSNYNEDFNGVGGADGVRNLTPQVVYHTIVSGTGNWDAGVQNPALLNNAIKISTQNSAVPNIQWRVEVKLSKADFNLPDKGYFGLYTNIMQTSDLSFDVMQYPWPFAVESGASLIFNDLTNLPADNYWGNVTLDDSAGSGVFIASSDITTNHGGGNVISTNEVNTFSAIAHNAGNNASDMAEDVTATFRWANFGLPSRSSFHKIPTDAVAAMRGNPPPAKNIPPTGSKTYSFDWSVSDEAPADQADYTDGSHWCLKVTLDSSSGVPFIRQSAQRNMDFAETSSPFTRKAIINARGIKPIPGKNYHDYVVEERFYNYDPKFKWKSKLSGARKIGKDLYRLHVPVEKPLTLGLSVLPPAQALVPYKKVTLGKKPIEIPVRNGQLITVLVDKSRSITSMSRQKVPVTNTGRAAVLKEKTTLGTTATLNRVETSVAGEQFRKLPSMVNMLASWKGSKEIVSSFHNGGSFKVPKNARTIVLSAPSDSDSAVSARIYVTDPKYYNLAANPSLKYRRTPNGVVNLGANLPMVVYLGRRNTGKKLKINDKTYNVYQSAGSFAYIIKGKKVVQ